MKLVLATQNPSKLKEMQEILAPYALELLSQCDFDNTSIEETGLSFVENALLKARHAAALAKLPAIADDSGLCVEVLEGQPGIRSARFAGPNASSSENIKLLLSLLKNKPDASRSAYFFCAIVLVRHPLDPTPIICQAAWPGVILEEARGQQGFGYDPIFYLPEQQKTAAELPSGLKHALSHRGQALRQLLQAIKTEFNP